MANPEKTSAHRPQVTDEKRRKTHGRATLADVARHAGVTAMTVSRTLREPLRVSAKTAEKVQSAIKQLGYAPNKSAGLLASGRSRIVAALVPNIANSIFAETIQGLSDALQADGLELLLAATGYSMAREEDQIRAVLGWAPSALVVTGRHHSDASVLMMRQAKAQGVPVIEMWDQTPGRAEFIQIGFNHGKAGRSMFEHLSQCGYQRIVFVESGVVGDLRAHERRHGFVAAGAKAGKQIRVVKAPQGEPMAAGRKVLQGLIDARALPEVLAFSNDYFAAGACLQALEQGIAIPEQLGIMGFGDMPIAGQIMGGLSTLAVPRYGIGLSTGQRVLAEIAHIRNANGLATERTEPSAASPVVTPHLVARQSTRRPVSEAARP
ncbi:MAG: LacI family DNA-binding transcriptional regulator [Rhodoferax sp.]|nr:LacI family DNA-binding transcriptional regulator [Rhodoferax sp.]